MAEKNHPDIEREPSLRPSPAIRVLPEASVAECISEMKRRRVGSVLVIHPPEASSAGSVVGIFTERDFLMKSSLLGQWPYQDRSVREVMTTPVITLGLNELHRAPEMMLKGGFRHLPIVSDGGTPGERILVGVLSIRDLLMGYFERVGDLSKASSALALFEKTQRKAATVGLIARSPRETSFVRQGLANQPKVQTIPLLRPELYSHGSGAGGAASTPTLGLSRMPDSALRDWLRPREFSGAIKSSSSGNAGTLGASWQDDVLGTDVLIFDLDGWSDQDWAEALKGLSHLGGCPPVLILFDPLLHSPTATRVLLTLGQSSKFQVFSKPINPLDFFWNLESQLRNQSKTLSK
jgi:CBS domain-containing protein